MNLCYVVSFFLLNLKSLKSEENGLLCSRDPSLHTIKHVGFATDFKAKIRTILARTFGVSWAQEMDGGSSCLGEI